MGMDADRRDLADEEPRRALAGGAIGLLSGLVALGAAQLVSGLVGGASSPMIAVGSSAIDLTPAWLKEFAIRTFGTDDKLALLVGIGVVMGVAAIVVGVVSVRRPRAGVIGIVAFGAIGVIASVSRPANGLLGALPSILGTLAGLAAYRWLRSVAGMSDPWARGSGDGDGWPAPARPPAYDRRRLLRTGAIAA